jgi:hypothetical protein
MTNLVIDEYGTKSWYNEKREYHREDGPAIEWADGTKCWYINGKNKEDGPAVEFVSGEKNWLVNDLLHRKDGPAIEWANGDKEWWYNGDCSSQEEFEKIIKLRMFW